MRKGRVGDLEVVLILEAGWLLSPWPEMLSLGRNSSALGKRVNSVLFLLSVR